MSNFKNVVVKNKIGRTPVQFTPTFFKTAYKQYQDGHHERLISMMKEAQLDSQAAGCLLGRNAGFQRDWAITPADSESKEELKKTAWLLDVLKGLDTRYFFKSIHKALLFKYSVIDFNWSFNSKEWRPVKVNYYDQRFFKYDPNDKKTLKIDQGSKLEDIPKGALVCETNEIAAMLPVLRDYILKNFGLRTYAQFLEVFGVGIIMGKYPPSATAEQIQALQDAIDSIAESSRGSMPEDTDIDIISNDGRSTDAHKNFTEMCDKGISIALLGHANATQQSSGMQVGENSTSYKVKHEIAVDDMYFIAQHVNNFIRMVWDYNFPGGNYPTFSFDTAGPIDVSERLEVIDSYYEKGGIVDPSEYAKLGIKINSEQEPLKKQTIHGLD